jgi:hypothetical protein
MGHNGPAVQSALIRFCLLLYMEMYPHRTLHSSIYSSLLHLHNNK